MIFFVPSVTFAVKRLGGLARMRSMNYMAERKVLRVMFLCTGNACRSQMAEGLAREVGKGILSPFSAGLMASGVHPRAVEVMREIGIDISDHRSKEIDFELLHSMDLLITLCSHAERSCPVTPSSVKRLHWPIEDPVWAEGTEAEIIQEFRRARDEIREKITGLVRSLNEQ